MVVLLIIWWVIGSAILAVPVYVAAKIVKVNLDGYGWAFIATLLVSIVQAAVAKFVPEAVFGLPIATLASILILSVTLGATLPKASLILVILAVMFVIFGFVAIELGGRANLNFYGHRYSFSKNGNYSVDMENGLPNGHAEVDLPDGSHYSGEMGNGEPDGQGTETKADGTRYIGHWENGKPNGQGALTSAGYSYTGEFRDGQPRGQGTLTLPDGKEYVGEVQNGQPNGRGTVALSDGTKFVGGFANGEMNGQGTLTKPDGTNERGEWANGREYKVSGIWIAPDGAKEEGNWNNDGNKSGGTIAWKDGRQYQGDWKLIEEAPEVPDGAGKMSWADGRHYEGQFHDGKMDGQGKMTFPDGKVQDGLWKDDKFTAQ